MMSLKLIGAVLISGVLTFAVTVADDLTVPSAEPAGHFDCRPMPGCMLAQAPDEGMMMPREQRRRMHHEMMQQRKHLEQLRILKMLELLDLKPDQEVPFLTAFNAMRERQRELDTRTDQALDSLAQVIHDGAGSDARINALIDQVKALEVERHGNIMAFVDRMRGMLTPEQTGKFIIFHKRFEAELLEQVGRFRRGMGAPGSPEGEG
ncbi:MAG: hypothetical protein AB1772_00975 [Candidatus Zixiibacteriota bacterium]